MCKSSVDQWWNNGMDQPYIDPQPKKYFNVLVISSLSFFVKLRNSYNTSARDVAGL